MNARFSSSLAAAALLVVTSAVTACGPTKYAVMGTDLVAGADAAVTADVKPDQNQTMLKVRVDHLAPPARVKAGATAFVAWQRKDAKAVWTRIGGLEYDEGARRGDIEATVPETGFELIVTAEPDAHAVSPSPEVVMAQVIAGKS